MGNNIIYQISVVYFRPFVTARLCIFLRKLTLLLMYASKLEIDRKQYYMENIVFICITWRDLYFKLNYISFYLFFCVHTTAI